MSKRKYNEYLVLVTFQNGNTEEIEYTSNFKKKADKTSYKEMLFVYSEIKEQYESKNCTIDFLGVNDEEKMVIFSKQNIVEEISDDSSLRDDVVLLFEQIKQIRDKATKLNDKKNICNTDLGEIYHKEIELAIDIEDSYKVQIFDKLRNTLINRRQVSADLDFYNKNKNVLDSIFGYANKLNDESEKHVDYETKLVEKFKETGEISTGQYIVQYSNFKDRITKMTQLQAKYSRIINDEENSRLICSFKKSKK